MLYLWDVKRKDFNWKHVKWGFMLCEFDSGSFGLGIDSHYSNYPARHRYSKSFWISFRLAWAEVMLHADWGRKAEIDEMHKKLRDRRRSATL